MTARSRRTALTTWLPWMERARAEAARALSTGDIPVGALLLDADHNLLAAACNGRERDGDATAHAELLALRDASRALGRWRLDGCTLICTLEPCLMCAGALLNARVARLVYAADEPKSGAVRSRYAVLDDPRLNHQVEVIRGIDEPACAAQLRAFFDSLRRPLPSPGTGDGET